MERCVVSLLVGPPGPLRDSLRALVAATPLSLVTAVDSAAEALDNLRSCSPALVLIDFDPADPATWELLRAVVSAHPVTHHIVLVDTVEEQRQAVAAGAVVVLLKGFPASRLAAVIKSLLPTVVGEIGPEVAPALPPPR